MRALVTITVGLSIFVHTASAESGDELNAIFEQLTKPVLSANAVTLTDQTVTAHDFVLTIDSARFYPYESFQYRGRAVVPGGLLSGSFHMHYKPSLSIERDQTMRILDTTAIDADCSVAELYGASSVIESLLTAGTTDSLTESERHDIEKQARREHERLIEDENLRFTFSILKGTTQPIGGYLMFNTQPDGSLPRVVYTYDPQITEQVTLHRFFREPGRDFWDLVNSYATEARDGDWVTLNGVDRSVLDVDRYTADVHIPESGDFSCRATMTFICLRDSVQLLDLILQRDGIVDSIQDAWGRPVEYRRWKKRDNRNIDLYLMLNSPLDAGDSSSLTYWYHGDVVKIEGGFFRVASGSSWHPRPADFSDLAGYDMHFTTFKDHAIVASGRLVDSSAIGDSVMTRWQTERPVIHASFNIGYHEVSRYTDRGPIPIDVYFGAEFQKAMRGARNMPEHIAEDVGGAVTLFTKLFGPCQADHIAATEIIAAHGQAFPGMVHLGAPTWYSTSHWGDDEMFRAHEVAHQWWGVGVIPETYHDAWLSEGFAEYCGLLYFETVKGDDWFVDRVGDYQSDIFSQRKRLPFEGKSPGPIALGPRTHTTDHPDAYQEIVYKKGALVLHMLRGLMTDPQTLSDQSFFDMLKDWYQLNKGQVVTTTDFRRHVEFYTGIDMDWFFDQYLCDSYIPEYEFEYDIERAADGSYVANCAVTTKQVPDTFRMYVPIEIDMGKNGRMYMQVLIDTKNAEFSIPDIPSKPKQLRFDPFNTLLARVKQ